MEARNPLVLKAVERLRELMAKTDEIGRELVNNLAASQLGGVENWYIDGRKVSWEEMEEALMLFMTGRPCVCSREVDYNSLTDEGISLIKQMIREASLFLMKVRVDAPSPIDGELSQFVWNGEEEGEPHH